MSSEYVCLSTLRGISARAASILDRYSQEKAIWIPVAVFKRFTQTLYWGNFVDLDLHPLDGLDPEDRKELLDELCAYNEYLHRQREHERYWREQAEADWWSSFSSIHDREGVGVQLEEALQRLGLSHGVTFAEIRRAYRASAKALHPDKLGEDSTAQMVALNRAYETLCRFYHATEPGSSRNEHGT